MADIKKNANRVRGKLKVRKENKKKKRIVIRTNVHHINHKLLCLCAVVPVNK